MNKGEVYDGKYFSSIEVARNYIKFRHPKKRFKEPFENELVCGYSGMKFKVIELIEHTGGVDKQPCECSLNLRSCTGCCVYLLQKYEGSLIT